MIHHWSVVEMYYTEFLHNRLRDVKFTGRKSFRP